MAPSSLASVRAVVWEAVAERLIPSSQPSLSVIVAIAGRQSPPAIIIRDVIAIVPCRAAETDAKAAADLWLRSRRAAAGAIPLPVHDDDDVQAWFRYRVVQNAELWLAEAMGGALVGILVLDGPWVDQLYVEPALTGREIGSQLVRFAKHARPHGLRLWTFESNTGAQRFYERHGFAQVTRTDGRDNEEGAPDILYAWDGSKPQ